MRSIAQITGAMGAGQRVLVPLVEPDERARLMLAQAEHDSRDPAVRTIAANAYRLNGVAGVLERVQNLPTWQPERPAGFDVYQGAVQTLIEGGNCTAKTILALAMAMALDVPVRVGWVFKTADGYDHVAPLFAMRGRWQWGETLVPGARLGEHPLAARERLGG